MSSSPVSQLIQITAPSIDKKPLQSNSRQDGQFQDLLARASNTGEFKPKQTTETTSRPQSEKPATDTSEQDASPQNDEAPTSERVSEKRADSPNETPETLKDNQPDAIELSEAAQLLLATQVVPEVVLADEATPEAAVETTVFDTLPVEQGATGSEPEPQASGAQQANSIEVSVVEEQHFQLAESDTESVEQAAAVAPLASTDGANDHTPELTARELPEVAEEQVVAPETDHADEKPIQSAVYVEQTQQVVDQAYQPTEQPSQAVAIEEQPKQSSSGKSATPNTASAAQTESDLPEANSKAKLTSPEAKVRRTDEQPSVKTESGLETPKTVLIEDTVKAAKAARSTSSTHSTTTAAHSAGDDSASLRSPAGSIGEPQHVETDPELVPTYDRARFVQRVSRAFHTAHSREGHIQLRLSPPELGSMRIAISVHEGVVSAKVEAETAAARNVLLDNLPALRERLAEQDIRIEKFDVDVRRDGGQGANQSGLNDRQARQNLTGTTFRYRARVPGPLEPVLSTPLAPSIAAVTDIGLDVRV